MPKFTIAAVLLTLVVLAGTMTYTGFLVVGVVAHHLDIGRFVAGLLLGVLFARLPKFSNGKVRTIGLIPKSLRRPAILGLLALCLSSFVWRGDYASAGFLGFAAAFLLAYPWLKRAVLARIMSSIFKAPAEKNRTSRADDMVIDGEFREKKD